MDIWSVVDDADRAQWTLVPFESVGPLRFGMNLEDVAAVMDAHGFEGEAAPMFRHGALTQQADFRVKGEGLYQLAVMAYYRQSGELASVAVDALRGPQVSFDGMSFIGQVPSKLEERFYAYADARGVKVNITAEGEPASQELGLVIRPQRAGDILLTRAFFTAKFDDWANTLSDSVPRQEWEVR
ncbi:hypothetical protein [Streptomyces gibsoniae]|uniref:Uncharacterized protein n=1 Tax=Streptomyces gibsoniae TaxID=3075529 RepID=A0ABU2TWM7_9ACTN|nr:hypothetical protein [Streptomyces sp. DSM 41699]MDT0465359.1 hypothetical protein [Streptomyces sp. DSM 41699]